MLIKKEFKYIVIAPFGVKNTSLVISACKDGAIGVIDLEYEKDLQLAKNAIQKVAANVSSPFGVKLDGFSFQSYTELLSEITKSAIVILTYTSLSNLKEQVKFLRKRDFHVILEAAMLQEALNGEKAKVDGIIAKGNGAGGRVSAETTFILLQKLVANLSIPIFPHGEIGLHTAPACYTAGASGVVLDWQLAGVLESSVSQGIKKQIMQMDGSETVCVGQKIGQLYRLYVRPGLSVIKELEKVEEKLVGVKNKDERLEKWHKTIIGKISKYKDGEVLPVGQDIGFVSHLNSKFKTTSALLRGLQDSIVSHCEIAKKLKPLGEGKGVAKKHLTKYPIVQGPMSRVSDTPQFAESIAEKGGLPIMAVGMMESTEIEYMLENTALLLGKRSWGVGLLGFIPADILKTQIEIIKKYNPQFAILAGGQPFQAFALEKEGITTYVHTPSHALVKLYIEQGIKNFVLEGCECGGHIGRYTSFVLWEKAVSAILDKISEGSSEGQYNVLFAGGIWDEVSAVMVATIAAPLVQRGVNIGVLLGTAYLFTKEVLTTKAITADYQKTLIGAQKTVVLDCGGGYSVRSTPNEFFFAFEKEKRKLKQEGKGGEEIRNTLEQMILGRLRIAAKGVAFNTKSLKNPKLPATVHVPLAKCRREGIYMAGQVIGLAKKPFTIDDLHKNISVNSSKLLDNLKIPEKHSIVKSVPSFSTEIAVVGMSCILPKSANVMCYWENILNRIPCITEVPQERWDWRDYYSSEPKGKDKFSSRWGGFIDPILFDPTEYGIPPRSMSSIEPMQILALEIVHRALEDAGYIEKDFDRENTSVILGVSGGLGELGSLYCMRSILPTFMNEIPSEILKQLPVWTEDTFPGLLGNVIAGRIANYFNLGGSNLTVDAACASSLAALLVGIRELVLGTSKIVIVGAVDGFQNPFAYFCFEKTGALSPTGEVHTFDSKANGTVISDGTAAIVLKRLEDAIDDGDRIYAVIKGIGSSSDGRGKSLTAPKSEGQIRAIERAYAHAGFPINCVELVEAHGTGTTVGDAAEAESLDIIFRNHGAVAKSCAVGSVKSMIGHTKSVAGLAGLIKTILAVYNKVLPPTIGVEKPHPPLFQYPQSPIYVNTETRPWFGSDGPRRAGVSAFGFGGTNFHVAIEEYMDGKRMKDSFPLETISSELFYWRGKRVEDVARKLEETEKFLRHKQNIPLRDLAYTLYLKNSEEVIKSPDFVLSIVADSLNDLIKKIGSAKELLQGNPAQNKDFKSIYFSPQPMNTKGKVAFLFSGQGSQKSNMLKEISLLFWEMRDSIEKADKILKSRFPKLLSQYIYPPPVFTPEEELANLKELTKTNVTQPALGTIGMGLFRIMKAFGITPDMVAGHSLGEYIALCAADVMSEETLYDLLEYRGSASIVKSKQGDKGEMLAVRASLKDIEDLIKNIPNLYVANLNSPQQTILSGNEEALRIASNRFNQKEIYNKKINVDCAFHSPYMANAKRLLENKMKSIKFKSPSLPVYSNLSGKLYPKDSKKVSGILNEHLVNIVKFKDEIENMYEHGARIFIEVGPGRILTNLINQILKDREYLAIPTDTTNTDGFVHFLNVMAELLAEGVKVDISPLFERRTVNNVDVKGITAEERGKIKPTTWMISPDVAWLATEARPKREKMETISKRQTVVKNMNPEISAEVILKYQKLMQQFLDYQKEIMLTYLSGKQHPGLKESIEKIKTFETDIMRNRSLLDNRPKTQETLPISQDVKSSEISSIEESKEDKKAEEILPKVNNLKARLLEIVSERTGYPSEMLDLNSGIETDLGIDSIKKVEILSTFMKEIPNVSSELVAKLNESKTLGNVLEHVNGYVLQEAPPKESKEDEPLWDETAGAITTKRGTLQLKKLEKLGQVSVNLPPGLFLITDDGGRYAKVLKAELEKLDREVIILQSNNTSSAKEKNTLAVNFGDPKSVETILKKISDKHSEIACIIHLLPLRKATELENISYDEWEKDINEEVKGLFYLLKCAGIYSKKRKPNVVTCMQFGGKESGEKLAIPLYPWRGGITGIIKTVAKEWQEVVCKALIVEDSYSPQNLAKEILKEISNPDGQVELYYRMGYRWTPELVSADCDSKGTPNIHINDEDVVLVVGGARGITAQTIMELTNYCKPRIILVGSSPLPEETESTSTYGITSSGELKKILAEELRREGKKPIPKDIEERYKKILKEGEIRNTFELLKQAGIKFTYYQVDVKDDRRFGEFIGKIYHEFGRIDGVINGAGIIEDKLIEDKTPDSFDKVFETKVKSSFVLCKKLKVENLKFLVLFSSTAGPFGNKGQVDYSSANDILNRMALYLNSHWPCRVVAINWGPWDEVGMVSETLREQFKERGIDLIPVSSGRKAFVDEIFHGKRDEPIAIIIAQSQK